MSGNAEFEAVFEARLRKSRGPITVFLRATQNNEPRIGLSVGRKYGNAVVRGRFKRMMREVFRHHRFELPTPSCGGAYDIVVTTRRHDAMTIDSYSDFFMEAVQAAHRTYEKRVEQ
jgi:ribonuclease P protein component